jgi:hypothetical protein
MSKQTINVGSSANDGTGDPLRTAMGKVNSNFTELYDGSNLAGATAKVTPVDADQVPLLDSAASNALKKVTWANIKATFKSYFDTLYALASHTHTASQVTDFDTEVSNNTDVAANTAARHSHSNKSTLDNITAAFTTAQETKLAGIATGATANATDAQLRDRSTHTGTQSADTITDGTTNKAFTDTEKTKLAGIETSADVTDAANVGSSINGASAKSSLVDADKVGIIDSEASNVLKTATIAQLRKMGFECMAIVCSNLTDDIVSGTGKMSFRMPYAFTLSSVRASMGEGPTGSSAVFDINESGTSVLSTKLSIDSGEKTSTTAASAAVISDTGLADDAEITVDFDQVGASTAGKFVTIYLIGKQT